MSRTPDITVPDLTRRRAVVTGASDGIGFGIARTPPRSRGHVPVAPRLGRCHSPSPVHA